MDGSIARISLYTSGSMQNRQVIYDNNNNSNNNNNNNNKYIYMYIHMNIHQHMP